MEILQKYEKYINNSHLRVIMLSTSELKVVQSIALGNNQVIDIAKAIGKSDKQVYRTISKLVKNDFLTKTRGKVAFIKNSLVNRLTNILIERKNVIPVLSGYGIPILSEFDTPKKISDSSFKQAIVYKKIKMAQNMSIVLKKDGKYKLNDKIWQDLILFLREYRQNMDLVDNRVPVNSKIYYKTDNEILFANPNILEFPHTAFSAYQNFGIKVMLIKHFYYLPIKKLSKKEVFLHSLIIAEKEPSVRYYIFIALFYLKHKIQINNIILKNIKSILKGEKISGYPNLEEIKDRAKVYDIRI
jgi:hypothetical protein